MASNRKVAIVTGASGGIGAAIAQQLHSLGYVVYGLNRKPGNNPNVRYIAVDVTDTNAVSAAISSIAAETGQIDLLIANAGYGISGAMEFTPVDIAQQQMDVNVFGFVRCAQAVLPYMRGNSGKIIAISSVAAPLSIPFQSFYSASKAALNAVCLALANEVRPFGIKVTAILPGDVATGFTAAREKQPYGNEVYGDVIARSIATMERDEQHGMTPAYVAKKVCAVAKKKRPKPMYVVGFKYKCFTLLQKLLPARLVNYIVGLIYTK